MTKPYRIVILEALMDVIRGVTPAKGYENDLSEAVFLGRTAFGDGDPLPMVSLLEDPRQFDIYSPSREAVRGQGEWHIILQGFVKDDRVNPTYPAYVLSAEVRDAICKFKVESIAAATGPLGIPKADGRNIAEMKVYQPVVRPADDVSAKAYFWMPVVFTLVEDPTKAFT